MKKDSLAKIFTALITSQVFCVYSGSAVAQSPEDICIRSFVDAAITIGTGRDVTVVDLQVSRLSVVYEDYPQDTPIEITIVMEGSHVEYVLESPQFMSIVASQIMNRCSTVGLVSFGMNHTGWIVSYGKVNGQLQEFECIEPGIGFDPVWGEIKCV